MTETYAVRVARGSAYLMTQRMVTAVISAVAFAFIARTLTQTEMGVTVALTLTLTVAQLLSDVGFSSGLTKHIAEYRGRDVDYSSLMFSGFLTKVSIASLIAVICALMSQQLSQLLLNSGEYAFLFQLFSLELLFASINITMTSFLQGLNKIREIAILSLALTLTRQVSAVTFLISGFGLAGLLMGWTLGDFVFLVLSASIILKGRHLKMDLARDVGSSLKMLARFSWPLFLVSIVAFFYSWFDRAVLLAYVPLTEVAVYGVAFRAFSLLYLIPVALSTTLFPYYSEQYGKGKHESIAVGVRAATRYISLVYTPLALGLMITASPTISLFAGRIYVTGDVILAVLSIFAGVSGISAAFNVLLLVYDMTPSALLVNLASVMASLVMLPLLLPSLGVVGMAVVKGLTMVLSLVFTVFVLRKRVRLEFDKEAMWKGWSASVVMFLIVGLVEQVFFSRYLLPLYILVGGVVYVIMLRIMKAVNEGDIQLFRNLMGKRGAWIVDSLAKILM